MQATFICPKCGFENKKSVGMEDNSPKPQVVCCDLEEGGCDTYFAVSFKFSVETTVMEIVPA